MHPHDTNPAMSDSTSGLEIRPRVLALYIGVGVVILAASVFAALILRAGSADTERMLESIARRASLTMRLQREILLIRVAEKNLIIETTDEGMDEFASRVAASERQIVEILAEFGTNEEPPVAARLDEFRNNLAAFQEALHRTIELSRRNSLARAAALSRGTGRDLFQQVRGFLMSIIERDRQRIAEAAGDPGDAVRRMTATTASARRALECLHDLLFYEQAILTVFSTEERDALTGKLESQEKQFRESLRVVEHSDLEGDRADAESCAAAFEQWARNSQEVRRLAREDTKAQAMKLSTSAVREAYLRLSRSLEQVMESNNAALEELRQARARAVSAGRNTMFGLAAAGLLIVALTAWLVVNHVLREFRAAAEVLMRS